MTGEGLWEMSPEAGRWRRCRRHGLVTPMKYATMSLSVWDWGDGRKKKEWKNSQLEKYHKMIDHY